MVNRKQKSFESTAKNVDLESYGDWITFNAGQLSDMSASRTTMSDICSDQDSTNNRHEFSEQENLFLETLRRLEKKFQSMTATINSTHKDSFTNIERQLLDLSDQLRIVLELLSRKNNLSFKGPVSTMTDKDKTPTSSSIDLLMEKDSDRRDRLGIVSEQTEDTMIHDRKGYGINNQSLILNDSIDPTTYVPSSEEPPSDLEKENRKTQSSEDGKMASTTGLTDANIEDVRTVLSCLDQLLEALPSNKIKEFSQSEHFVTYKRLFRDFDLNQ